MNDDDELKKKQSLRRTPGNCLQVNQNALHVMPQAILPSES